MSKLVGYVRVSGKAQIDGYGLPNQRADIRAWAKAEGHRIVAWCEDAGVTGTVDDASRPGLACALEAIASGSAEGMVVPSLHRLARKLHIQEAVLSKVWGLGGRMFTVDAGEMSNDDDDDPMRVFVRQVMGAAAQLERGLIQLRLKKGRAAKRAATGRCEGPLPYGADDDGEAAVVARIVAMSADGASIRAIAQTLNTEGVTSKRGGQWHPQTVARVLAR